MSDQMKALDYFDHHHPYEEGGEAPPDLAATVQELLEKIQHLKLSRRAMLKAGLGVLAGVTLPGFFSVSGGVGAQPPGKRIYIAADEHTDYFWTADANGYRAAFLRMLDYYLDLTDATITNPSDFQSRWNCDCSMWVWEYERNRTPAQFQRLIDRIRSGHVSVPLNMLVTLHGASPAEAVVRGMYYAGQLERRFNLRFPLAISMENQTLPYGLVSLWAGAGAQYSWRGICNCATFIPTAGDRDHDIYWYQGRDGARILMKWNSLLTGTNNQHMGGYAEARDPAAIVDYVDSDAAFQARYPYDVIGCFGFGWDDLQNMTDIFVTTAQTKTTATRRVIVSNEEDFFVDFEAAYGATLPVLAVSYGNEWDLAAAALQEVGGRLKRALERLRGAEALAAVITLDDPNFMNGRATARDNAWRAFGSFYEHNFGEVYSNSRGFANASINWRRGLVNDIETYVNALEADARQSFGRCITRTGTNERFYAFNPLSWTRTDFADYPYSGSANVFVVDLVSGAEVPSQIVTIGGQRFLRVLARDVPSVGYKVFEIRSGPGGGFGNAATVSGSVIENSLYSLTVANRGAITSLIDRTRGNREFARNIGGRVVNDLGTGTGTLTVENAGPVSVTLVATATGTLNHTSRLTLFREINRIDIRNLITQNFGGTRTFAFGFELDNPDVWHEEVGAVIRARLVTNGGHYATRNARYDWMTFNHFADMTGSAGVGVTLSNRDAQFFKLGNSDVDTLDTATPQISALVGGLVDAPGAALAGGVPSQGGDTQFNFHFALQTHDGFSQRRAMQFALEHQSPLLTGPVLATNPVCPEDTNAMLTISDPDVLLWALKPGDDADLLVTRFWNMSPSASNFTVQLDGQTIVSGLEMTHLETPTGVATVTNDMLQGSVGGHQMRTYGINPTDAFTTHRLTFDKNVQQQGSGLGLPGDTIIWLFTLRNGGNFTSTDVTVIDVVPPELQVISAQTAQGTVTIVGQEVTFFFDNIPPLTTLEFTITTTVLTIPISGVLTNSATLVGTGPIGGGGGGGGDPIVINVEASMPVPTGLPLTGYPPRSDKAE